MGLFSFFRSDQKEKRQSHIKNLLEIAIADGKLDEKELEFVISIAEHYKMTREDVMEIRKNPSKIRFQPPTDYKMKVKLIEDLVRLMIVDNEIHEDEVKLCKELSIRLNLAPSIVDEMISGIIR